MPRAGGGQDLALDGPALLTGPIDGPINSHDQAKHGKAVTENSRHSGVEGVPPANLPLGSGLFSYCSNRRI